MSQSVRDIRLHLKTLDEADPQFPLQNAVASFLFMVMPIDGQTHPKELERLTRILSDDFQLSPKETEQLINNARERGFDEKGMSAAADILKSGLSKEELLILVSHLWEMVFADGRLHEMEVLLVERLAAMLEISPQEVTNAMTP